MGTKVEARKDYGPRGPGEVRVLGKTVKIIFDDGQVFEIAKEDAPKNQKNVKGVVISLSPDKSKIYGIFPANGSHVVRFDGFGKKEGEPPKFKLVPAHRVNGAKGKTWVDPDRLKFTALLEIVGGDEFTGMHIPLSMDYLVDRTSENKVKFVGKESWLTKLTDFLSAAGFDFNDDELAFSENILPELEDLLLGRKEKFLVLMEAGWANKLSKLPPGMGAGKKRAAKKPAAPAPVGTPVPAKPRRRRAISPPPDEPDF